MEAVQTVKRSGQERSEEAVKTVKQSGQTWRPEVLFENSAMRFWAAPAVKQRSKSTVVKKIDSGQIDSGQNRHGGQIQPPIRPMMPPPQMPSGQMMAKVVKWVGAQ